MKFTEYCEQNGIKLLREDMKYLRKMLDGLKIDLRKGVLMSYAQEWSLGISEESNVQLKQNSGRRRANLALPGIIHAIITS